MSQIARLLGGLFVAIFIVALIFLNTCILDVRASCGDGLFQFESAPDNLSHNDWESYELGVGAPARSSFSIGNSKTVTLYPVADSTIRKGNKNANYGNADELEISLDSIEALESKVLVRFNLEGAVPPDATVNSASLQLYMLDAGWADAVDIAAVLVLSKWSEDSVTWNSAPDTSWMYSEATINSVADQYKTWSIPASFIQYWLDDSGQNYGLELSGLDGDGFYRIFYSQEAAPDDGFKPRLLINYTLPPPTPTDTFTFTPTATRTKTPTRPPTLTRVPTNTATKIVARIKTATQTPETGGQVRISPTATRRATDEGIGGT